MKKLVEIQMNVANKKIYIINKDKSLEISINPVHFVSVCELFGEMQRHGFSTSIIMQSFHRNRCRLVIAIYSRHSIEIPLSRHIAHRQLALLRGTLQQFAAGANRNRTSALGWLFTALRRPQKRAQTGRRNFIVSRDRL